MTRAVLFLCILLLLPVGTVSAGMTTSDVITRTMSGAGSCANWKVSGVCFWLKCPCGYSCCVRASVRVTHFRPDVVVSTYHDASMHPWSDYGAMVASGSTSVASGLLGLLIDSAGTRTRDNERRDRSKLYRDGDAIGHPLTWGFFGYACPAATTAFYPYFNSMYDAMVWRGILPVEMLYPQSLTPGMREIGSWPTNTWSNLYPRDGNVTQEHFVKGAAVISQRIGDIATRNGQPHVYNQIPTGGIQMISGYRVWLPSSPLVEMDPSTGKWQMISPVPETSCGVFGVNDTLSLNAWGDGKTDAAEGYSFNLWREYSCCQKNGTLFLYAITW